MVLARALWREGYNDHLAGHITVNLGDGTLLCNPWLLTWAELRPVAGAAHRPRRARWSKATGRCRSASRCTSSCTSCAPTSTGPCTTTLSTARCGPTWARSRRSWTRARRSAAAGWPWSTSTRARSTTRPVPGGPWSRWARPQLPCWPGTACSCSGGSARAVHQRAVALEQRCQHAWYVRAGRGTGASPLPAAFLDVHGRERRRGVHRVLGGGRAGRAAGRPRPAGLSTPCRQVAWLGPTRGGQRSGRRGTAGLGRPSPGASGQRVPKTLASSKGTGVSSWA